MQYSHDIFKMQQISIGILPQIHQIAKFRSSPKFSNIKLWIMVKDVKLGSNFCSLYFLRTEEHKIVLNSFEHNYMEIPHVHVDTANVS